MERIIIYDLYKYKLVLGQEESINASFSNRDKKKTGNLGFDTKLFNILHLSPLVGWTEVKNPEIAFKIADDNRLHLSSDFIKRLNPSVEFFENRKRLKTKEEGNKGKKKKKYSKSHKKKQSKG